MALSVDELRAVCTDASLERGKRYFEEGRVSVVSRTPTSLSAKVRGTKLYYVGVDLSDGLYAVCTCPYSHEGYCKHIAAVLIAIIEGAREEQERSSPPAGSGEPYRQHRDEAFDA